MKNTIVTLVLIILVSAVWNYNDVLALLLPRSDQSAIELFYENPNDASITLNNCGRALAGGISLSGYHVQADGIDFGHCTIMLQNGRIVLESPDGRQMTIGQIEPPEIPHTGKSTCSYEVQEGDTLTSIADRNSQTLHSLTLMNPQIDNPDLVVKGQSLKIACADA